MSKKQAINKSVGYVVVFFIFLFSFLSIGIIKSIPVGSMSLGWSKNLTKFINCQAVSYSGELVGIGTDDGFCFVFDKTGKQVFEKKYDYPVLEIKFSFNDAFLFVKSNHSRTISLINLSQKKVVWEKFKTNFVIDQFWVFRDGKSSILFTSEKDKNHQYVYLNQNGATIKEFSLPEIFYRFQCSPSSDGKFVLISLAEGDIYLIQNDGILNWNIHLEPAVREGAIDNPILQIVSKEGVAYLAYQAEEFGKSLFICQAIDSKQNIIWKKEFSSTITDLQLAPDEKKIMMSISDKVIVFETNGRLLFSKDQYGYNPVKASLGSTNILIGFIQTDQRPQNEKSRLILKLFSLNRSRVLWQKRTTKSFLKLAVSQNGFVLLEISQGNVLKYFRYVADSV